MLQSKIFLPDSCPHSHTFPFLNVCLCHAIIVTVLVWVIFHRQHDWITCCGSATGQRINIILLPHSEGTGSRNTSTQVCKNPLCRNTNYLVTHGVQCHAYCNSWLSFSQFVIPSPSRKVPVSLVSFSVHLSKWTLRLQMWMITVHNLLENHMQSLSVR